MIKYAINPKYEKDLKEFLLDIKEHFDQSDQTIHKARNELKIIPCKREQFVVKSFKIPNLVRRIIYTYFRDSKAKKSYENSIKIGDLSPEPIGYIEFYTNNLLAESYFIAKKFEFDFTIKEPIVNKTFPDRENIFQEFAKFTYTLHEKNILHNDYSPGNILIKKDGGKYTFKIVDINRMKFKKLLLKERLKNFAKLWLPDEDMKIIAASYAKLMDANEEECINIAKEYSHRLKSRVNMKKRLKGIPVVD